MNNRQKFEAWLKKVDLCIEGICGLNHADLSDWSYRDSFEDRESPEDTARDVLEENGLSLK